MGLSALSVDAPLSNNTKSLNWISKEKLSTTTSPDTNTDDVVQISAPPKKKQKISMNESKAIELEIKSESKPIVNIPCDVSENIEKLKQRLLETLKMYEILSKDED